MTVSRSDSNAGTAAIIESAWYRQANWLYLLWPLSLLYRAISTLRRGLFLSGRLKSYKAPVPVIIVGNISVGGTGKTPLVIALVKSLQRAGYRPGIVSRGYGSAAPIYPFLVSADGNPLHCGDEPLLMAIRTGVPVVIDANRVAAAQQLLDQHCCDIIVSDDGLQHYALQRDIELVVIDGQRGFGNSRLLPMGPLREAISRLNSVDFIVCNGQPLELPGQPRQYLMQLKPLSLTKLTGGETLPIQDWTQTKRVHALAGIGNPQRFYQTLQRLGFDVIPHSFVDHHDYCASDLQFADDLAIIMTEKDAVKIRALNAPDNCWFLPVQAEIDQQCLQHINQRVQTLLASH